MRKKGIPVHQQVIWAKTQLYKHQDKKLLTCLCNWFNQQNTDFFFLTKEPSMEKPFTLPWGPKHQGADQQNMNYIVSFNCD